jgi:hypothetical protein
MNDEDLRDLFAFGAMIGAIMNSGIYEFRAVACYSAADAMIRAKYAEPEPVPEEGITAIKPKRKPRSTT